MAANRFAKEKTRFALRPLLSLLLFCGMLGLFSLGLDSVFRTTDAESLRAVQRSVVSAAVHCYAVEGAYPPSLGYLEENYGLRIDRSRYQVHYRIFASNLFPDVTVFAHNSPQGGDA